MVKIEKNFRLSNFILYIKINIKMEILYKKCALCFWGYKPTYHEDVDAWICDDCEKRHKIKYNVPLNKEQLETLSDSYYDSFRYLEDKYDEIQKIISELSP